MGFFWKEGCENHLVTRGSTAYSLEGVMPPNVNVGALAVIINLEGVENYVHPNCPVNYYQR